ncbi:MAG TPA: hypothetical protein PKA13_25075 [Geminicoccaceae bacterium]|nr:hypothetical protein [Geminicoccus sp.]HMU53070.1 hypothetical protein [Geminicoccaceae bacterium]
MTRQFVFLRRSAKAVAVGLGLLGGLAATDARAGLAIDRTPLDPELGSRTANEHRTFIVAGCVPKNLPKRGLVGSVWVACNDLDFVKDKVVESEFHSCLDIYPNGVLQGLFIKEINNRTWQSFRFSCRDLRPDGSVGASFEKAPFLFNYEREGTLYETTVPTSNVTMGIFEVWNRLQLRESLLQVGLMHQKAQAIHDAGRNGERPDDLRVTDRIPPASPHLIGAHSWQCPSGMVMTGAAIGHIPDRKGKDTRPVYILAECRALVEAGVERM